ncbi:hypothetical protein F4781DRAFT_339496 [Annulohypoxylon bovei var. microspora]|nr:hypothetical protein F4781DRAFT_339496 [Annulohypoxylon bovei var. microspora]
MRSSILLFIVVALCFVGRADWLNWSGGGDHSFLSIPHETGNVTSHAQDGWTPKPTSAPDAAKPEGDRVLELLERGTTTTNWTNADTCGWIEGSPSSSFGCGGNGTCATNANHIVACVSATYSPFYSMCLNYDAYTSGSCKNEDSSTGCW